jgi:hypothetical protein
MDYKEAAEQLISQLTQAATEDAGTVQAALETAGPVHTEALLASLAAFNAAARLASAGNSGSEAPACTPAGAQLQPLPEKPAELTLDFPLTAEQLETLKPNHLVPDGWERWYAEFDGKTIRYYRNATGYCFFAADILPDGDAFMVKRVVVNQDDDQYTETNLGICAAQLKILLANDLGLDDEEYWDEMD